MRLLTLPIGLLIVLAGCLGSGDDGTDLDQDGTAAAPTNAPALPLDWTASDCRLAVTVLLAPFDHLDSFLPDGYEAADASGLLGLPAPVGQGAGLLTAYTCGEHAQTSEAFFGAEINILVADPGLNDTPADNHYYLAQLAMPAGDLATRLANDGWNVVTGNITLAGDDLLPAGNSLAATVTSVAGTEYDMSITAAAPSSLGGVSRFWHDTPAGPSWFDYTMTADVMAGGVQATWTAGTLASDIGTGATAQAGIIVPAFSWSATYYPPSA